MFSQSDAPWKRNIIRVSGNAVFMKGPLVGITEAEILRGPLYIHTLFAGGHQAQSLFLYCSISWPEETRKYPHSHMDLFPDHRSLNNFSKNTLQENKWTFNDKQFLWASLYIYTTQLHAGLMTKVLNSLRRATVCHPAKAAVGAQLCSLPSPPLWEGVGWPPSLSP